ncbi:MarR family winged helix-turn-helix transcriptional regulator [Prosthecomicrobium sp. N25]|uniref:MarR family winged helix-turn-helix transcriptional regulator n=1 Tax=Prosthecomicrobium sp. N25 TaxID=3129254 RepID=UPI003077F56B
MSRARRALAPSPDTPVPPAVEADLRVDLGPLPNLVGYAMRRTQVAVFADFIATLSELGLRPAQFSALLLIDRNPGRKQSEIAEALGIQRPNFVAMMDEMDRRGLTRRLTSETDRRSYVLELTEAGRTLLERAVELVSEHEARITRDLSRDEVDLLLGLLARIAN